MENRALLVGAAYQVGALPLPAEAIEQAIELNGVAVEANLQAFRRGRQAVADPAGLAEVVDALTVRPPARPRDEAAERLAAQVEAPAGSELEKPRSVRSNDLDFGGQRATLRTRPSCRARAGGPRCA